MIRSIAGSIARPIAVAITGASGVAAPAPEAPEALEAVRALDTSNGGDLDVSILDFGKTGRIYSDFEGTEAGEGDSVALVGDDIADNSTTNVFTGFTNIYNGTVTDNGDGSYTFTTLADGAAEFRTNSITVDEGAIWSWSLNVDSINQSAGLPNWQPNGITSGTGPASSQSLSTGPLSGTHVGNATSNDRYVRISFGGAALAGDTITVSAVEMFAQAGASAFQNSAASRPTLETDAFGTLVAATDGVDDGMNLSSDWAGDGTEAICVSMAITPDPASSETFARLIDASNAGTGGFRAWIGNSLLSFEVSEAGTANFDRIDYDRPLTANETIIATFRWAPGATPKIYINGALVSEGTSTYTALDSTASPTIFYRAAGNSVAGTFHGMVGLVGALTDAQKATVETYLASLTGDTLLDAAPLTVLRRVATPATDLNVTDTFDYADTAALLQVWTKQSGGSSVVEMGAGGDLELTGDGTARGAAYRVFRTRVGFKHRITVARSADGESAGLLRCGITPTGTDYANESTSSGQTETVEFEALTDTTYVWVATEKAANTHRIASAAIAEIARTTALYDFLDETKMTDSSGATQELDSGIELVLPSVADGDDAFGAELNNNLNFEDWTAGEPDGFTLVGATSGITQVAGGLQLVSDGSVVGAQLPQVSEGVMIRCEITIDSITNGGIEFGLLNTGNAGGTGRQVTSPGTHVIYQVSASSSSPSFKRAPSSSPTAVISRFSAREVLYYPLQQTSAASQPELQYAPHQYLDGVVFSGRETSTGSITSATTLQDLSGNSNQPAVNGTLTVSAVGDATVYSGFSGSNYLTTSGDHLQAGTADWSMTLTARNSTGATMSNQAIFEMRNAGNTGSLIRVGVQATGYRADLRDDGGTSTILASVGVSSAEMDVITLARRGAAIELWQNGSKVSEGFAASGSYSGAAGQIWTTGSRFGGSVPWPGEIGTIRFDTSGYAPTADEIASLHADLAQIYSGVEGSYQFAKVVFDGTDDYFEAIDPDGDLAITGDVTIVAAVTPDNVSGAKIFASARSSTSAVAPWVFWLNNTHLSWVQGDGVDAPTRTGTSVTELSSGETAIVSGIRTGAEITFAKDISAVETAVQFNSAVPPTSDSNVSVEVGSQVGGSAPHDGTFSGLAIIDGALPTGQIVHMERALREHINGVTE